MSEVQLNPYVDAYGATNRSPLMELRRLIIFKPGKNIRLIKNKDAKIKKSLCVLGVFA